MTSDRFDAMHRAIFRGFFKGAPRSDTGFLARSRPGRDFQVQ
jgi:hypothetical protein